MEIVCALQLLTNFPQLSFVVKAKNLTEIRDVLKRLHFTWNGWSSLGRYLEIYVYIYIYIYILLIPTAIACMRVTGEWALLFWTPKKFGHVSACSGSVMIPSMGLFMFNMVKAIRLWRLKKKQKHNKDEKIILGPLQYWCRSLMMGL